MANEFFGETEITPEELSHFSNKKTVSNTATEKLFFVIRCILIVVFGILGLVVLIVMLLVILLVVMTVASVVVQTFGGSAIDTQGIVTSAIPEENRDVSTIRKFLSLRALLLLLFSTFVFLQVNYRLILKPIAKSIMHQSSANFASGETALVKYKVDPFGLEYNIQSAKQNDRYKMYWRNFTDAEYSPEAIRFYKGKRQTAFVLMRAFTGREREVGQFIEATMNKTQARLQKKKS